MNLLSGLLICGCCGSAYCGWRPGGYFYYRCVGSDKYRRDGQAICQNKSVKGGELDALIWSDVCELLRDPNRLRRELERRRDSVQDVQATTKIEKSVRDLRSRINRLIDAYTDGSLAPEEFKPRVGQLRERLRREEATYESQTRNSTDASDLVDIQATLEKFSKDVVDHLETADEKKKRDLIKLLVKRIEITADAVRVVYKVPIHPFVQGPASWGLLQHRLQFQQLAGGKRSATMVSAAPPPVNEPRRTHIPGMTARLHSPTPGILARFNPSGITHVFDPCSGGGAALTTG